jgi:hypothetical protein
MLTEQPNPSFIPAAKISKLQMRFWFGLSLLLALIYTIPVWQKAFSGRYMIQDDARQHVFWMRRFLDPELFPNDLIADYFQSVAPWGYSGFYHLFAWVGVDPVLLSKLLPPLLGLVVTAYGFGIAVQLLPLPAVGFVASLVLNQLIWMRDDLSSATPGAFFYPVFLAFLYYLLRGALLPCLGAIVLQGLFYPQGVLLIAGILLLRLVQWRGGGLKFSGRGTARFCLAGLGTALAVMLLYAAKSSEFGSVITAAEAKTLPAFSPTGWSAFFSDNPTQFWFCGKRSGMIPSEWCEIAKDAQEVPRLWLGLLRLPQAWLGLLLPLLLKYRDRFPLAKQVRPDAVLLLQCLLASLAMFFVAHLLAFKLHLPNRYTEHSVRILAALATGLVLVILWDWAMQVCFKSVALQWRSRLKIGFTALLMSALILHPYGVQIDYHTYFPITTYSRGEYPALYKFFARQPKDSLIASLTEEVNQLPSFAERSVLVGGEGYTLPYHPKYFKEVSQRTIDLMNAQYSPDLKQVQGFVEKYGVDFWLVDRESFQPNDSDPTTYMYSVFQQFPETAQTIRAQLQSGAIPALSTIAQECSALKVKEFRVIKANCILHRG